MLVRWLERRMNSLFQPGNQKKRKVQRNSRENREDTMYNNATGKQDTRNYSDLNIRRGMSVGLRRKKKSKTEDNRKTGKETTGTRFEMSNHHQKN